MRPPKVRRPRAQLWHHLYPPPFYLPTLPPTTNPTPSCASGAPVEVLQALEAEGAALALEGASLQLAAGATERGVAALGVLLEFNFFAPEGEWDGMLLRVRGAAAVPCGECAAVPCGCMCWGWCVGGGARCGQGQVTVTVTTCRD